MYLTANYTVNEYRLVNGKDEYEGRLEVRPINGSWGSALGVNWNFYTASIACQVLGHSPMVLFIDKTFRFGIGSGPLYGAKPDTYECTRSTKSFKDCGWFILLDNIDYINQYQNYWNVGMRCLPCEYIRANRG